MAPIVARDDRCIGWHCLTDAQKFGIIFSIVVVSVVLTIAYLFYLGRRASEHESGFFVYLPGGRRTRRGPKQSSNVAMAQLPVVQHWPGQGPQVFQQPVVYQLDPNQPPRAYAALTNDLYSQPVPLPPTWGPPLMRPPRHPILPAPPCASG